MVIASTAILLYVESPYGLDGDNLEGGLVSDLMGIRQSLYALALALVYIRFIQSASILKSVGVLQIILRKMLFDDLSKWLVIATCFSIGFGLAFTTLMPGKTMTDPPWLRPFWSPFWAMVGTFDVTDAYEYNPPFTNYNGILPGWLTPPLIWLYVFFVTVVLLNLLIAQMSSTYSDVKLQADEYYQMERLHIVLEYKDNRDAAPPPLNLFVYLWQARSGKEHAV